MPKERVSARVNKQVKSGIESASTEWGCSESNAIEQLLQIGIENHNTNTTEITRDQQLLSIATQLIAFAVAIVILGPGVDLIGHETAIWSSSGLIVLAGYIVLIVKYNLVTRALARTTQWRDSVILGLQRVSGR